MYGGRRGGGERCRREEGRPAYRLRREKHGCAGRRCACCMRVNESCGKIPRRKSVMGENKFSIIFDLLKADILAGKFAGGRPLPSAPALMRRIGRDIPACLSAGQRAGAERAAHERFRHVRKFRAGVWRCPVAWRGDCRGEGARRGKADRGDPPPRLQDVLLLLFVSRYGSGSGTACAGTADQVIAEVVGTFGLK